MLGIAWVLCAGPAEQRQQLCFSCWVDWGYNLQTLHVNCLPQPSFQMQRASKLCVSFVCCFLVAFEPVYFSLG